MGKTLCVVPCGAKKIWDEDPEAGPTRARDVYRGPFATKCREYAMKFYAEDWVILSAKYGFLKPDDVLPGPYNTSFNDPKSHPIGEAELHQIAMEKGLLNYQRVVVLGGKNYVRMIQKIFRSKQIEAPLEGCRGIGYMMGRLKEMIDAR